jgi:hypothetical protein
MAFNVDEIRARLQYGGARPNLFNVTLTPPTTVAGAGIANQIIPFVCKAASLPSSIVGTIEIPYFGRKVKVPGDRTYVEWVVTVINDENFLPRRALESWFEAINHPIENIRTNGATGELNSYKGSATVVQYSKEGEALYEYELIGLYPSEVGSIETSWETNDTIEEFSATFQYDYWINKSRNARTRSE